MLERCALLNQSEKKNLFKESKRVGMKNDRVDFRGCNEEELRDMAEQIFGKDVQNMPPKSSSSWIVERAAMVTLGEALMEQVTI